MAKGKRPTAAKASTSKRAARTRAKVNRKTSGSTVAARARSHPGWTGQSTFAKALRDAVVWEMHLAGDSVSRIHRVDGRSERQIERVLAQWREDQATSTTLLEADPVAILEGMIRRSQMRSTALAKLAGASSNPSAAVGAMRAMREEDAELRSILQETGKLPREMGTFRHVLDLRQIGLEMLETMDALQRGEITIEQARAAFERFATYGMGQPGTDLPQLPPGDPVDA